MNVFLSLSRQSDCRRSIRNCSKLQRIQVRIHTNFRPVHRAIKIMGASSTQLRGPTCSSRTFSPLLNYHLQGAILGYCRPTASLSPVSEETAEGWNRSDRLQRPSLSVGVFTYPGLFNAFPVADRARVPGYTSGDRQGYRRSPIIGPLCENSECGAHSLYLFSPSLARAAEVFTQLDVTIPGPDTRPMSVFIIQRLN